MPETNDERDLVSQAMKGDRVSVEKLLLDCYSKLRAHVDEKLLGGLRQLVDADDIVQQTYAKAFAKIDTFEPRSEKSFLNWLKTIASHEIVDFGRRRVLERRAFTPGGMNAPNGSSSSMQALLMEIAGDDTLPTKKAIWNELLGALQVALAGLPTDYQDVIRLHYLQGLPLENIGQRMARSTDAIRGMCYRARNLLRDELSRISKYV